MCTFFLVGKKLNNGVTKTRIASRLSKKKKGRREYYKEYGKGAVNSKFKICANNPDGCAKAYLERRAATGRGVARGSDGARARCHYRRKPLTARSGRGSHGRDDAELAYADYQQRKEAGDVTLGAEEHCRGHDG